MRPIFFFLMRHGRTIDHVMQITHISPTANLDREGIENVKQQINIIKKLNILQLYSSYRSRSIETSKIISDALNLKCTYHKNLNDISKGILSGLSNEKISSNPFLKKINDKRNQDKWNYENKGLKIESYKKAFIRINKFILKEKDNLRNSLIITHSGIIRAIIWGGFNNYIDNIHFGKIYKVYCNVLKWSIKFINFIEVN